LWGDLRRDVTDEHAVWADELARSLRHRLASAQPGSMRVVAFFSRLSLQEPWGRDLPARRTRRTRVRARLRRRLAAATSAFAFLFTACVSTTPPSVTMRDFKTDVRVGPAELAAAHESAQALPSSFNPPIDEGQVEFSVQPGQTTTPRRTTTRPTTPVLPCPTAAPSATPDEQPSDNVTKLPREGSYRWRGEGERMIAAFKVPIAGFHNRLVRSVQGTLAEFTFQTVQPVLSGNEVTTWRVRTDTPSEDVSGPGVRTVVGAPGRGIAIVGIERVDAKGQPTGFSFKPAVGVTIVPLPLRPGESFTSTDADPRTGVTLQNSAEVLRKERVDACGKVVDGWLVKGTLTRSTTGSSGTVAAQYEYVVAPQLGGVLVRENVDRQGDPEDTVKATYTIGQLDPDPLPKERAG
jgi:hypothetical protein